VADVVQECFDFGNTIDAGFVLAAEPVVEAAGADLEFFGDRIERSISMLLKISPELVQSSLLSVLGPLFPLFLGRCGAT
jgi:hypothetical protein